MLSYTKPHWQLLDLSPTNPEYELFDNLICEFTDISGFDVQYYVKNPTNVDYLYGESTLENFDGPYDTKMIYQPAEENIILNIFGMSADDSIEQAQIPKSMFSRDVSGNINPKVGDVIRTKWNNRLYEVTNISAEKKIFQGKKLIWDFMMKPYRHNEAVDNSIIQGDLNNFEETDDINNIFNLTKELSGFGENEQIEQESEKIHDPNDIDENLYGYGKL